MDVLNVFSITALCEIKAGNIWIQLITLILQQGGMNKLTFVLNLQSD